MSTKRIFVINGSGIANAGRKIDWYQLDVIDEALTLGLPGYTRAELPVGGKYGNSILCFVAPSSGARANFLRLSELANCTPLNCVFALWKSGEVIGLYRSREALDKGIKKWEERYDRDTMGYTLEEIEG